MPDFYDARFLGADDEDCQHEWSDCTYREVPIRDPYEDEVWGYKMVLDQPIVTAAGSSFVWCVRCGTDGYRMPS